MGVYKYTKMFNNGKNIFATLDKNTNVKKVKQPEVLKNGKNIFNTIKKEKTNANAKNPKAKVVRTKGTPFMRSQGWAHEIYLGV